MEKKERPTKYSKVSFLPIFTGVLSREKLKEIREQIGNQPRNMDYRKEFIKGRGASMKDATWNRTEVRHMCCSSRVPWRHRAHCPKVEEYNNDDLSDLKD